MTKLQRLSTGIESLDSKLSGGYPRGKGILITGVPGSGKTILGLHAIHKCCVEGKKCLMIATEETPDDILYQAEILGLDLTPYYENGILNIERILEKRMYSVDQMSNLGYGYDVSEINILDIPPMVPQETELVVIDNLGVFVLDMSVKDFRGQFDALNHLLSDKGCTTLFIMDKAAYEMTNQIADYSVYGAIHMLMKENPYTNNIERYLSISKMRSTNISLELSVFSITSRGIVLSKKCNALPQSTD